MFSMHRFAGIFALLTLLFTAAPLLACMTETAMSGQETACCRAMHGQCNGMESMGCCRTSAQTDEHPQLAAAAPLVDLHLAVVDWLDDSVSAMQPVAPSLRRTDAHAPPGQLLTKTTVLRI